MTPDVISFHRKIPSTFPFISASINAEVSKLTNDVVRQPMTSPIVIVQLQCTTYIRSRCSLSNSRNQLLRIKQSRYLQIIATIVVIAVLIGSQLFSYFSFKKNYLII